MNEFNQNEKRTREEEIEEGKQTEIRQKNENIMEEKCVLILFIHSSFSLLFFLFHNERFYFFQKCNY